MRPAPLWFRVRDLRNPITTREISGFRVRNGMGAKLEGSNPVAAKKGDTTKCHKTPRQNQSANA